MAKKEKKTLAFSKQEPAERPHRFDLSSAELIVLANYHRKEANACQRRGFRMITDKHAVMPPEAITAISKNCTAHLLRAQQFILTAKHSSQQ